MAGPGPCPGGEIILTSLPDEVLEDRIIGTLVKWMDANAINAVRGSCSRLRGHATNTLSHPRSRIVWTVKGITDVMGLNRYTIRRLRIRSDNICTSGGVCWREQSAMLKQLLTTKAACFNFVSEVMVPAVMSVPGEIQTHADIYGSLKKLCPILTALRIEVVEDLSTILCISCVGLDLLRSSLKRLEIITRYSILLDLASWAPFVELRSVRLQGVKLQHDDVQELALLPKLHEVEAECLEVESMIEVPAAGCAWRILRLSELFTLDMVPFLPLQHGVRIVVVTHRVEGHYCYCQFVTAGTTENGGGDVSADFVHKINTLRKCLESVDIPIILPCRGVLPRGTIRTIAPLFDRAFPGLCLNVSDVDKATAQEIVDFMPYLKRLEMVNSFATADASDVLRRGLIHLETFSFQPMDLKNDYISDEHATRSMGRLALEVSRRGGRFTFIGSWVRMNRLESMCSWLFV